MDNRFPLPSLPDTGTPGRATKFSIVMPCFNEARTLKKAVAKVLQIADEQLSLELIIVDDASTDQSLAIAKELAAAHPEIIVLSHEKNQGKGAALRTGFKEATGDFVGIQDADLEYNPMDLRRLLIPLINDDADVVIGSRFLTSDFHRVLYFWHSLGNRFLTFISNMFTDLNLSDMETCYKVFRRDVIQGIDIKEDRFGFEPEIIAKVAHERLRIFEIGISYHGRTYEEGKKIGFKDGLRALYCIIHYNAYRSPLPIQFLFYLLVGGTAAFVNISVFSGLYFFGNNVNIAAPAAFVLAAVVNYVLSILFIFRQGAKWNPVVEQVIYWTFASLICLLDWWATKSLIISGMTPLFAKTIACIIGLLFNFFGRRLFVFPEGVTRGYGFLEAFLAKERARMAGRLIPSSFRQGRILDIGCGSIPFFLLNTDFNEKYGVDPVVNPDRTDDDIILRQCDVGHHYQLDFEDGFFDVVTMLAVFEHIEKEKLPLVLTEIKRVLKGGGRFILTTPAPWTDRLLRFMAWLRLVTPDEIDEHQDAYSHRAITDYLCQAGFERERVVLGYFELFFNIWAYAEK